MSIPARDAQAAQRLEFHAAATSDDAIRAQQRLAASVGDLTGRDITLTAERIAHLLAKEEALRVLAAKQRSGKDIPTEALRLLIEIVEELGLNPESGHVQAARGVAAAAVAAIAALQP